ncbi:MAG TPA: chemotaxis protein CheB [Dokdonella sp.]
MNAPADLARYGAPTRIIVIGGSAGSLAALRTILPALPADLAAPVCIAVHIGRYPGRHSSLELVSALPLAFAADGEALRAGRVYLAPPDHHLLVTPRALTLSRGPRENFVRPAIDPLFRSAAQAFGAGVIGVVLSGRLNDGTAGLYELKQHGGTTIVQDPADADEPQMPASALAHVEIDHRVRADAIAPLLAALAAAPFHVVAPSTRATDASADASAVEHGTAQPFALICPECGGALRRREIGLLAAFECHIGHRVTAEVLAAAQLAELERHGETMRRLLNERAQLARSLGAQARAADDDASVRHWEDTAREAIERRGALDAALHGPTTADD